MNLFIIDKKQDPYKTNLELQLLWAKYNAFIKPVRQTQLSHKAPVMKSDHSAPAKLIEVAPLDEIKIPEEPFYHVLTTLKSIGSTVKDPSIKAEDLIDLTLYTGLEQTEDNKVITLKGKAGKTFISEYLKDSIAKHWQALLGQDPNVGRVQFWDETGKLLPTKPFFN